MPLAALSHTPARPLPRVAVPDVAAVVGDNERIAARMDASDGAAAREQEALPTGTLRLVAQPPHARARDVAAAASAHPPCVCFWWAAEGDGRECRGLTAGGRGRRRARCAAAQDGGTARRRGDGRFRGCGGDGG
eukprot:2952648-Prymnesium_polylepis.1